MLNYLTSYMLGIVCMVYSPLTTREGKCFIVSIYKMLIHDLWAWINCTIDYLIMSKHCSDQIRLPMKIRLDFLQGGLPLLSSVPSRSLRQDSGSSSPPSFLGSHPSSWMTSPSLLYTHPPRWCNPERLPTASQRCPWMPGCASLLRVPGCSSLRVARAFLGAAGGWASHVQVCWRKESVLFVLLLIASLVEPLLDPLAGERCSWWHK